MAITLPSRSPAASSERQTGRRSIPLPKPPAPIGIRRDPGLSVPSPVSTGLVELGRGVQAVGEGIQRAVDRQQKLFDETLTTDTLISSENRWNAEFIGRRDQVSNPDFVNNWDEWLDNDIEKTLGSLPEGMKPLAREALRRRMLQSAQPLRNHAGLLHLDALEQGGIAAADRLINQRGAQAERDPDSLPFLLSETKKELDPLVAGLSPAQRRAKQEDAPSELIKSALIGLVRRDRLMDAETELASGKYDEQLSRTDRASVLTAIEAQRRENVRLAEKAERDAEDAIEDAQEQRAAELFDRITEGALSDRQLDEELNKRTIKGNDYIMLRRTLESEAAPEDDPDVYRILLEDAHDEVLTEDRIFAARANGLIRDETMRDLLGRIDRVMDEGEREALEYIRANVGGVRGPLAILDSQASQREAMAIREARSRMDQGENVWNVADDIVKRFRPDDPDVSAMPRPMFPEGNPDTLEGIEASSARTVQAFQAGEIDEDAFLRESLYLKQRKQAIEAAEKARADREEAAQRRQRR